jgi:hypothetical protein
MSSSRSAAAHAREEEVAARPGEAAPPTGEEARPDVTSIVAGAERVLVVGIGGGGDVVGALAAAGAIRALGTDTVVGGITWERRPVDPLPGPRRLDEVSGAQPIAERAALAVPETTGPGGFRFCESDMAAFLGEPTVLIDPNGGSAATAEGLDAAARHLGCDLVVLLDVGGDVLAHGDEAGLASPLADAVLLAAALSMATPAIGVVFGAACDGELTPAEVMARVAEVGEAGGLLGDLPLPPGALDRAEAALEHVTTEASAMAVRCARGITGAVPIRGGRRTVQLTPDGGRLIAFDPARAIGSAARCAAAVAQAPDLEDANARLTALGMRTELTYEREAADQPPSAA